MNHSTLTISFPRTCQPGKSGYDDSILIEALDGYMRMPDDQLISLITSRSGLSRNSCDFDVDDVRRFLSSLRRDISLGSWYTDEELAKEKGYWASLSRWSWSGEIRGECKFSIEALTFFWEDLVKMVGASPILVITTSEGSDPDYVFVSSIYSGCGGKLVIWHDTARERSEQ